jgi:excisionase family DNA binding protein
MSEPWLDVDQAAEYLGVSTKTVRRYAAQLGARHLGARLLFRPSLIDRFLETQALSPRRGRGDGTSVAS